MLSHAIKVSSDMPKTILLTAILGITLSSCGYTPAPDYYLYRPDYTPEPSFSPLQGEIPQPIGFPSTQRVLRSSSTRECTPKQDFGRIHFDCHISIENYETLIHDLQYLRRMSLQGPAALALQRELHLADSSGETLFHWLEEKVQFLLDEGFETLAQFYAARNVSNPLLAIYRSPHAIVEAPGFGPVEISSQRVGIVSLGTNFFRTHENEENFEVIHRLAALIHEARHNEGRGASFGFPHIRCPEGRYNSGIHACDVCNNGAYAIQLLFYQSALASCDHCSDLERRMLRTVQNIAQTNILTDATECDASLEIP